MNDLFCPSCEREAQTEAVYPVACSCGGLWSVRDPSSLRLGEAAGATAAAPTPLWPDPVDPGLLWKREDLQRTGSFKDRGAELLALLAAGAGARRAVVDSSGSAALAAASAGARAGLAVTVHTPAHLPQAKRDALAVLGAHVEAAGDRGAAAARAREAAGREFYFSHVYHPAFFEGTGRAAEEIWKQCDGRPPALWVVPVGNGSLLLGLARALERLGAGRVKLLAVQAAGCPGLRLPGVEGHSAAAGIAIADPPRREEILAALARHGGEVMEVGEAEIEGAHRALGRRGVAAERACAAALAAAQALRAAGERGGLLAWMTGSGLRG